ncbi:hypothetical protein OAX78_01425 [Planctomycetota bacterium]|nr:hypothetical protein [Planctomycetota bacterium]
MVLVAFAAIGITTTGCSKSSSNRGLASTVAPSSSGTTAGTGSGSTAGTNSSSALGNGPELTNVAFVDVNSNDEVDKNDRIRLTFAAALAPITATNVDAAKEFALAVNGDTFGTGAKVESGANPSIAEIVLGDAPVLSVSDNFDVAKLLPGESSGINVSPFSTGAIKGASSDKVRASARPMDVGGTLTAHFRAGGSLNVARGGHTAVTLDDGRVLVVGGLTSGNDYVADAELYDPMTDTFTRVSDLSGDAGRLRRGKIDVRMAQATAVKLNDGTVLISGGYGIEKRGFFGFGKPKVDTLESAFIFNPADNTFNKVGDMQYPRHSHTATLMDDGRVLMAGGYNESWWSKHKTQTPFEIYDPSKGSFEKVGSIFSRFKLKEDRMDHTATAIEGGTGILLTGGSHYKGGGLFGLIKPKLRMSGGSEVVRGTTTDRAGDLNVARMNHGSALVTPRNVLVAGGHDLSAANDSIEIYDSATAAWTTAGTMSAARSGCEIVTSRNLALIVGGFNGTAEVSTVDVFDVDARQLSTTITPRLNTARNGFTASRLNDGRVIVIGGFTGATKSYESLDGQGVSSVEIFVRQ